MKTNPSSGRLGFVAIVATLLFALSGKLSAQTAACPYVITNNQTSGCSITVDITVYDVNSCNVCATYLGQVINTSFTVPCGTCGTGLCDIDVVLTSPAPSTPATVNSTNTTATYPAASGCSGGTVSWGPAGCTIN